MTVPIAVVGPTASGKTALALDLAERLGGEIVNVDAMAQYRGMDIGTAKPPVAERRGIGHHLFDVLDVTETATVAGYKEAATAVVDDLVAAGRVPVIVGGSMMYVQGLLDDWAFPPTDPAVRARYEDDLARIGARALHARLAAADPAAAGTILDSDGRRIVRALEVVEITGEPFAASAPRIGEPRWGTTILAVDRDRAELDARISARTAQMFAAGFVDEVVGLCTRGLRDGKTASQAIGYAQVLAYLDGEYGLEEAQERTMIGTRQYVRRQRSWFRRDHRAVWLDAASSTLLDDALATVHRVK
ncbi:tRNA (adenosine(37)-N6)-dimethylallyltransferase MiaA [Gordonia sp. HY002]|uniref:tRNA (adenosine(37)-N6)-dimethylallyltransferase MiaA n=1 Tax=Gordonia zhenghanii TaxID=2911516 RepID=UPI001EF08A6F|nr:tRNA (adenosine(37)-N6)-dimethylallyltransferase MiaA [Gordonia zhenghanii]MCF8569635.1 tRNA (adenosine(37)-N6)-dimethylallyltransferase MiaA [Gordonia zhenghanii]MCF8602844.1 tRNA (adenosine(37)-N6)-dimethylallyltransferase MiaA [Gordonia zhenghanii]